jgi:two-component system OmpR family response regulator
MPYVLIVDDEAVMRDKLSSLLRDFEGLHIEQAFDAGTARKLMETHKFDVALVDMALGQEPRDRMAGISVLHDLLNQGCIPLVVSGTGNDTLKEVTLELGALDYVSKPFIDLDLINKVKLALHWSKAKQASRALSSMPNGLTSDPTDITKLLWKNKPLMLSLAELSLVYKLVKTPGTVVENNQLQDSMKSGNSPSALSTHFANVRKKFIGIDRDFKHSVNQGGGYIWK